MIVQGLAILKNAKIATDAWVSSSDPHASLSMPVFLAESWTVSIPILMPLTSTAHPEILTFNEYAHYNLGQSSCGIIDATRRNMSVPTVLVTHYKKAD